MKKFLYTWGMIVVIGVLTLILLAVTSSNAHAEDDSCPVVPPIINTVYVDRPVDHTVYVDHPVSVVHYTQVPVDKIVKVEVPVYETNPETSDPKILRAMMKVTHDRYLSLLAKYRQLKKVKR